MHIKIYEFHSAPEELRALSQNGGDEDWIAVLPPEWPYVPFWLEEGASFGCCSVEVYTLPDGSMVRIGCHA